jgi:hypothetical protein
VAVDFVGGINVYVCCAALVVLTNSYQKEEAIPLLQELGILRPDGVPETEKYQWKTIPEGAATCAEFFFARSKKSVLIIWVLGLSPQRSIRA